MTLEQRKVLVGRGVKDDLEAELRAQLLDSFAVPDVGDDQLVAVEEGLTVDPPGFAGADVISLTKGRVWPETLRRRRPALTSVSVIMSARR